MKKGIHFLFGSKNGETDFTGLVDTFAAVGYDVLEIPPEPFLEDGGQAGKRLAQYAAAKGVELVFTCGLGPQHDMASGDAATRRAGVAQVQRIIRLMDTMGVKMAAGTTWTTWPARRTKPLAPAEKRAILARTAEAYREAIAPIESLGLRFAIEPLNRFEGFLLNTSAEGVAFCEMVGNPNLGLLLDVFHMSVEEDDIVQAVKTAGKRLLHLHLAERNRRLPGTGDFCWDAFFAALAETGYTGCLDTEAFVTEGGTVAASVALWRDLSNGADRHALCGMMRESLRFISGMERKYFG